MIENPPLTEKVSNNSTGCIDMYSVSRGPKVRSSVPKRGTKLDLNIFIHYVPEYSFPSKKCS